MKSPQPYCIETRVRKSDGKTVYRARIRTEFRKLSKTFERITDAKNWVEETKTGGFYRPSGTTENQSSGLDRPLPY